MSPRQLTPAPVQTLMDVMTECGLEAVGYTYHHDDHRLVIKGIKSAGQYGVLQVPLPERDTIRTPQGTWRLVEQLARLVFTVEGRA